MSRVLPIFFNTEMVRAILDGRKTVTRRVINQEKYLGVLQSPSRRCNPEIPDEYYIKRLVNPPYEVGDILYIRETWRVGYWDVRNQMIAFDYKDGICGKPVYISDRDLFERLVNQSREDARKAKCEYNGIDVIWEKGKSPCRWRPSIHMPKAAARTWLEVTAAKIQRLQEMTLDDFIKEGVLPEGPEECNCAWKHSGCPESSCTNRVAYLQERYRFPFSHLWDSTIPKEQRDIYGWAANPWVWTIMFERCEKPEPCILKGIAPAEDKRPCIGYQKSQTDDEPCEMCKGCRACNGEELE